MSAILAPLLVFLVALVASAMCSGYETGFVSMNPIRIRYLAEEENKRNARFLMAYSARPHRMLTTLLVGNNIALIAATIAMSRVVAQILVVAGFPASPSTIDLITSLIVAPVVLTSGEIFPKSVFRLHPNRLSMAFLPPINVMYWALSPVTYPVTLLTRALLALSGKKGDEIAPVMSSLEDVRTLVDESVENGTIEPEAQQMIHSIIDMHETQAKEIMVPRIDIDALPNTATRDELAALFEESGRTRIPIYEETVDSIIGVTNAYDVLMDDEPENQDISRFVREVRHVPDSIGIGDLLRDLKQSKQHIAIITDEYGGTDGLVTIEDILEEIFGEIQDEHDREKAPIQKVGPRAFVVDARMPLEEAAAAMEVDLSDEDVETVGGWLMHVAGRIPGRGEVLRSGRFQVTVLDAGPNYVGKIRLDIGDAQAPPSA